KIDLFLPLECIEILFYPFFFLDLLGSKVFNVVQNDMNGNIEKIRKCYDADPTKSHTLEKLVIDEQGEKKRPATDPTHK
ncbi:GLTP-domain-containing protein, partial [Rhizophagus irregularis]